MVRIPKRVGNRVPVLVIEWNDAAGDLGWSSTADRKCGKHPVVSCGMLSYQDDLSVELHLDVTPCQQEDNGRGIIPRGCITKCHLMGHITLKTAKSMGDGKSIGVCPATRRANGANGARNRNHKRRKARR